MKRSGVPQPIAPAARSAMAVCYTVLVCCRLRRQQMCHSITEQCGL